MAGTNSRKRSCRDSGVQGTYCKQKSVPPRLGAPVCVKPRVWQRSTLPSSALKASDRQANKQDTWGGGCKHPGERGKPPGAETKFWIPAGPKQLADPVNKANTLVQPVGEKPKPQPNLLFSSWSPTKIINPPPPPLTPTAGLSGVRSHLGSARAKSNVLDQLSPTVPSRAAGAGLLILGKGAASSLSPQALWPCTQFLS